MGRSPASLRQPLLLALYGSHLILRREPPGSADRPDVCPAKRPVAPDGFLDEGLLVGVRAIAPVVLAKPVPESFDWIEFW